MYTDEEVTHVIENDRLDIAKWAFQHGKSGLFVGEKNMSLHKVKSPEMLDLLIAHYEFSIFYVYTSPHRDYVFEHMVKDDSLTPEDIIREMLLLGSNEDDLGHGLYNMVFRYGSDNMTESDVFRIIYQAKIDYTKYLGKIYIYITGHYPSIEEIRAVYSPLDRMMSMLDNQLHTLDKKRKL